MPENSSPSTTVQQPRRSSPQQLLAALPHSSTNAALEDLPVLMPIKTSYAGTSLFVISQHGRSNDPWL